MANYPERLPYGDASHPVIYSLAHLAFGQFLKFKYDIQIYGAEYLRRGGPRVYAPTHSWALDPEILGVSAEGHAVPTMAKEELWTDARYKKYGVQLGKIISLVDAFPVKRGQRDSSSYRLANAHVRSGRSVALFPQGTRTDDFSNMHDGAARIAYRNNVPLQPLVITRFIHPKTKIERLRVIASKSIVPDQSLSQHTAVEAMMQQLQETYERDYDRAATWAEHDSNYNPVHQKFGKIKRYP